MSQPDLTLLPVHDLSRRIMARQLSPIDLPEACLERIQARAKFAIAIDGIDALLTPTTMTTAVALDEIDQTTATAHYTRFGNFLDLCALSLPNGLAGDGLPTSLQIACRAYDESTALRIGWAFQDASDWHLQRPPE